MLFRYWTCKEAYVKARGEGLALPLEQVDISLEPGVVASLFSVGGDNQEASCWSFRELHPASGYSAALVVEGLDYRLKCWHWSRMP
jgi:4'-phosphopantetheinyl transferase